MGASHRSRFRKLRKPGLNRRSFLQGAGVLLAAPLIQSCGNSSDPQVAGLPGSPGAAPSGTVAAPKMAMFMHGVASGDPLTDRVILWTRVTLDAETVSAATAARVDYLVSLTPDLAAPISTGSFSTGPARDYTVKVDQAGLSSYTSYFYQFSITLADGMVIKSPIGRTRTAPKTGDTDRLRIVSTSCQNFSFGFFNPLGAIAAKAADLDLMLFLGDYIYETGGASNVDGRDHFPANEIISLSDYRQRHAQYKTDPDLQECHRQIAYIAVWDDHETTNNSYRTSADNHTPDTEGCWEERMGWAIRAYFEWMPIRDNASTAFDAPTAAACPGVPLSGYLPEGNGRIERNFKYGELADIIMLDTRLQGRAVQNGTAIVTAEQTILGAAQRERFLASLSASTATWKLIGQQMTFAPLKAVPLPEAQGGTFLNEDAWDGYRFDRNAVLQHIADKRIANVVFLSGDTHVVTAFDVPMEPSDPTLYNPATGEGSLAVEFSNSGVANVGILGEFLMANNPHLKYANIAERGYLLLDITAERTQGEYFFTGVPMVRSAVETFRRALVNTVDTNRLAMGTVPSTARSPAPPLAP
ncbi:MAG: alkaline phosphatase D family protein [Pseudomonadota bacterium]